MVAYEYIVCFCFGSAVRAARNNASVAPASQALRSLSVAFPHLANAIPSAGNASLDQFFRTDTAQDWEISYRASTTPSPHCYKALQQMINAVPGSASLIELLILIELSEY